MPDLERLAQLRRVIVDAPEELLHMGTWCEEVDGFRTAYCAAGWAAIDPWFIEHTPIRKIFVVTGQADVDGSTLIRPIVSNVTNQLAVLLDIDPGDSEALFGSGLTPDDSHRVPKVEVLNRIDDLIAGEPVFVYDVLQDEDDEDDDEDDEEI